MATWQERMAELAEEAGFNAALSGACGWCVDEGDEHRPAVFEYSRHDALEVARSGYLGTFAKAYANSKDLKKQKEVADFLAAPVKARAAGVKVVVDVTERQLGKAEFRARHEMGASMIMEEMELGRTEARKEWMLQEAERMASQEFGRTVTRNDANEQRRRRVIRIYRNLCNRYRK